MNEQTINLNDEGITSSTICGANISVLDDTTVPWIADISHTLRINISSCRSKTRWYHRLGRLIKAPFLYIHNGNINI